MATRYFKKPSPRTKVVLPDGRTGIEFWTFDGTSGYFETQNMAIVEHFLDCMRKNRYGITEVAQLEYEEAEKKKAKSGPFRQPLREEMGSSGVVVRTATALDTVAGRLATEAGAVNRQRVVSGPQAAVVETRPAPPVTAPLKPVFKPRTGKRIPKATT